MGKLFMTKAGKANSVILIIYLLLFLILFVMANRNEGPPFLFFALVYYYLTGAILGVWEFICIFLIIRENKKRKVLIWLVPISIFIAGSVYGSFFSNFVL